MLIKDAGRKRPHGRHARRLLYLFIGELELLAIIVGIRHAFQLGKGLLGQRPHIPVHTRHGCGDLAYRTLFCVRQLGDDVFSVSCGGNPAVAYDRLMRRTLLMQRMEEVLTPRELNLVRSYLGIGQPDEVGMTFQELAIYLNYNGPSGAEKAYKAALRKLKKDLYGGAYGRWLSAQKAIRAAKAEAEQDAGHDATPQRTWWEEKALANRFACEIAALIRVYEVLSGA